MNKLKLIIFIIGTVVISASAGIYNITTQLTRPDLSDPLKREESISNNESTDSSDQLEEESGLSDEIKEGIENNDENNLGYFLPETSEKCKDQFSCLGPGQYEFFINHDSQNRSYLVYVPQSYDRTKNYPLVLAFHGALAQAETQRDNYYLPEKAETAGFIAAFPQGAVNPRLIKQRGTWNAGLCCGYAYENQIDDVGFVKKMIADIEDKFLIDSKRIYATGMSNGGMFTYRLACELSDMIAAIGSVAGPEALEISDCYPKRLTPIIHFHALDDEVVLYEGKSQSRLGLANYTSVTETINRWVARNNCLSSNRYLDVPGAYCDKYLCQNKVEVRLCTTISGGHSWPGGKTIPLMDKPSQVISATDLIWDFFQMYSL